MDLRDFLYLDRPLVRSFLAQLEGGNVDELTERERNAKSSSVGGRLGARIANIEGKASNDGSLETEAIIRQAAASEFDRLLSYLQDDGLVVIDRADGVEYVKGLRRKQFLEIDGRLRLSSMQQVLQLMTKFAAAAPIMSQFGTEINVDPKTANGLSALAQLGALEKNVPVIVTVPGDARFLAALELDPECVLVDQWDLDASVLLKIQRVLAPGESQLVGDPMGGLLNLMPDDGRGKFLEAFASPDLKKMGITGDAEVSYPAIIATAIAIYR